MLSGVIRDERMRGKRRESWDDIRMKNNWGEMIKRRYWVELLVRRKGV